MWQRLRLPRGNSEQTGSGKKLGKKMSGGGARESEKILQPKQWFINTKKRKKKVLKTNETKLNENFVIKMIWKKKKKKTFPI